MHARPVGIALAAAAVTLVLLVLTLALPVRLWRTGEPPAPPLPTTPGRPIAPSPLRVWIDADAACGQGPRTDPDDCLAILLLASSPAIHIAGMSSVFGNASIAVTDSTTRALGSVLASFGRTLPPVYQGAGEPSDGATPASAGLRRALAEGPLVIVALGPLSNIAQALAGRPELRAHVQRLVAVMGRRRGHLFHPVEGGRAGSFLGHGPVFRDFNFAKDRKAAARVLEMGVPITLVPYEAAREVVITSATLDTMAHRGGAHAWVAERSRGWLGYWREDVGIAGFYPFDLLAATYVMEPSLFDCADTGAHTGRDAGLLGWLGRTGLFVGGGERQVLYCDDIRDGAAEWLRDRGLVAVAR
jgi:inosine-uridine nucleoside N-ribohydrolase